MSCTCCSILDNASDLLSGAHNPQAAGRAWKGMVSQSSELEDLMEFVTSLVSN